MIMRNIKNKTTIASIIVILILTTSTIAISMIQNVSAQEKTTISMSFGANAGPRGNGRVGQNQPAHMSWRPSPNIFANDPDYAELTSVWPDATVTFTRPDNTIDVVNGPFPMRPYDFQGFQMDILLEYTPNMMGGWTVNLYWPGDDTYNELNQTNTFSVQEYFGMRTVWARLSMRPSPAVGLLQPLLINAWISPAPLSFRDVYEGYMFTFTSPSGSSFTVGPLISEMPGTVWFDLPLTEVGDWTIKFEFPGDFCSLPATVTRTITVQEEWVTVGYPDTPLPTEEWTFPIHTQNREWRNIAGPWYMTYYNTTGGSWNPYTEAPRTAHILWKLPSYNQIGGFIGSPHSIEVGSGEERYAGGDTGIFTSSCPNIRTIMAGRGYYNAGGMIHCVDMRTGEELWAVEGSFDVGTESGRTAALYDFGSSYFRAYNAITGAQIHDVPGISMSGWLDPYVITSSRGRLIKWDTTGSSSNFESRIVFNVTMPKSPSVYSTIGSNLWFTASGDYGYAYNLTTGALEYDNMVSDPGDPNTWIYLQGPATGGGYGLAYQSADPYENEGLGYAAYDVLQGKLAWNSEKTAEPWGNFWAYNPQASGNGMVIGMSYAGVYAFNVTNGEIVWHYIDTDTYFEEPYSSNIDAENDEPYASYAFGSTGPVIGGDVVYAPNTEHSATLIFRGQALCAIDAFTGDLLWRIKGAYTPTAIAYGVLLAYDSYNGFTYAFGKGTTETTVSTQNDVYAKGSSVLLKGSVLDMSPAQAGTAAVSDASQTAYMEYLHMQQPMPMDATGVSVTLDAIDPNGNFVNIGTATSNTDGKYALTWTPEHDGKYEIIATFEGSESYYASHDTTYIGVGAAVSLAQPIEPEQPEPTEATEAPFITTETAIIAAVAIAVVIGIVAYWALRKRK